MKYIIFEQEVTGMKEPVIFGNHTTHSSVKIERAHPVSAGYFKVGKGVVVSTYGDAPSLGLKPEEGDDILLEYVLEDMGGVFFMDFLNK